MSAQAERLAHMANQIARNLAIRGDEAAARETADHIAAFWDPRMKAGLLALAPGALDPIAAHAAAILAGGSATPPHLPDAAEGTGSDAG